MKAALRVLTALSERHKPDQADVDELHWYAPAERERPIDELVCDAIQRAMKDREQRRKDVKVRERARTLAMAPAADRTGEERDSESERLIREHEERRTKYAALSAKLKRLGIAMQLAAESMMAAEAPGNSEAAAAALEPAAREADLSGILRLLREHIRLAQDLNSGEQALKERGIE